MDEMMDFCFCIRKVRADELIAILTVLLSLKLKGSSLNNMYVHCAILDLISSITLKVETWHILQRLLHHTDIDTDQMDGRS